MFEEEIKRSLQEFNKKNFMIFFLPLDNFTGKDFFEDMMWDYKKIRSF